jgi:hypothetical protein
VYTNWDTPSKADQKQTDCVILDSEEGKWRDVPCNVKHKFICKKTGGEYSDISYVSLRKRGSLGEIFLNFHCLIKRTQELH